MPRNSVSNCRQSVSGSRRMVRAVMKGQVSAISVLVNVHSVLVAETDISESSLQEGGRSC